MKIVSSKLIPERGRWPGTFTVQVPKGDEELRAQYKLLGGFWESESGKWSFPLDMAEEVAILLEGTGHILQLPTATFSPPEVHDYLVPPSGFRQYQKDAYDFAMCNLQMYRGVLLRHDTGMGKTWLTIALLQALDDLNVDDKSKQYRGGDVLIVCGASGLDHWSKQLKKYWQDLYDTVVVVVDRAALKRWNDTGSLRKEVNRSSIILCSYSMLHHIQDLLFTSIVFDEIHALQDLRTRQGKAAERLVSHSPSIYKIGLSATPVKDKPDDIHGPWSVLRPKQVQTWKNFVDYYMVNKPKAYQKYNLVGIKPELVEMLNWRISLFTHTATKKDWSHLLPKIDIKVTLCRPNFIGKAFDVADLDQFTKFLEVSKDVKTNRAFLDLEEWFLAGVKKVLIGVYHHSHAEQLGANISERFPDAHVTVIDEAVIKKRHKLIDEAIAKEGKNILIVTMKANGQTIDSLNVFKHVLVLELSYEPTVIEQFLGRVGRNSEDTSEGVQIRIIAVENTVDEVQANKLVDKIKANEQIMESTHGGELVRDALGAEKSDEDILSQADGLQFAKDLDLYGDDL